MQENVNNQHPVIVSVREFLDRKQVKYDVDPEGAIRVARYVNDDDNGFSLLISEHPHYDVIVVGIRSGIVVDLKHHKEVKQFLCDVNAGNHLVTLYLDPRELQVTGHAVLISPCDDLGDEFFEAFIPELCDSFGVYANATRLITEDGMTAFEAQFELQRFADGYDDHTVGE